MKKEEKKIKILKEEKTLSQDFSVAENSGVASLKKNEIDGYDELENYKKLRKRRVKKAVTRMIIWVVIVLLFPIFVFLGVMIANPESGHNFFGYTIYIVKTDSMLPDIAPGDSIIDKKVSSVDEIKLGTDITFIRSSDGEIVTHKVFEILNDGGTISFITKGTHMNAPDQGTVNINDVLGIRVKTSHFLGVIISFFRTTVGVITLFGIFALFASIIYICFRVSNDIKYTGKF